MHIQELQNGKIVKEKTSGGGVLGSTNNRMEMTAVIEGLKKIRAKKTSTVTVKSDSNLVIKGITDKNYITNSYHVPVFEEIDAFSKLKLESEFQRLSPGGAISYVETPNLQNNLEVVLQIMRFIYDNIMYAELNTKSDYCQKCGYTGEILIDENLEWYCPNCGNRDHNTLNVARRTCGYIGSNFWNKGRTQEIKERVLHIDNKDFEEDECECECECEEHAKEPALVK